MKATSLFLLSLVTATLTCSAQSTDSLPLKDALDAPGKGYRDMVGFESKRDLIFEEKNFQEMKERIKDLEAEASSLKQQLQQLNLEYKKEIELLNSIEKQPSSTE